MRPPAPASRQNGRFRGCAAMTKRDVINQIGQRIGQDPVTTRAVIESFFETVKHSLTAGEAIYVRGFGSFQLKRQAAKVARHIPHNLPITVPAHTVPIFKPATEFAQQVRSRPTTKLKRKV